MRGDVQIERALSHDGDHAYLGEKSIFEILKFYRESFGSAFTQRTENALVLKLL